MNLAALPIHPFRDRFPSTPNASSINSRKGTDLDPGRIHFSLNTHGGIAYAARVAVRRPHRGNLDLRPFPQVRLRGTHRRQEPQHRQSTNSESRILFFYQGGTVGLQLCDPTERQFLETGEKHKGMRYRVLLVAASLSDYRQPCGQSKLAGKWQTDNACRRHLEAQKNPPPAPEPGARGGRGGGGAQAIILDLKVDASGKISGMVNEIGNGDPLTIESGMITGKTITWVTQPRGVTWNLEMTDDDTVTLTGRVFAARGGGGGAPGGAPPAGGPPPGGGAAPGGGAPGGGGGGRGGGGRGPQASIVFHRVK